MSLHLTQETLDLGLRDPIRDLVRRRSLLL